MMSHRRLQQNRLLDRQETRGDTSGGWVRRHYRPSPFSHGLRDECNCNEGDEVLLRALENRVQPPVAAEPSERPFNHPADARGNELSVSTTRNGLNGDAECLTGLGQSFAPVAEIAERRTLEAAVGEFTQNRHDGFGVM